MQKNVDLGGQPFHFLGIGGIGMSALAHILTHRDLPVSGSDLRSTHITQRLQEAGAHIFWQQEAGNLDYFQTSNATQGLPQVICSTAIQESNPEYQAAIALGCPIFHRSDVLAALIAESSKSISVAGTHGKTTTSSLIGHVLVEAGLDPTVVIGGEVQTWQGNARVGNSEYLVAEADESDGSLTKFQSQIGIITNIELDHPDHYETLEQVVEIFKTFVQHCQQVVVSADCPTIRQYFIEQSSASIVTYSLNRSSNADYCAELLRFDEKGTTAMIYERGQQLGEISTQMLGRHNLSNTLAAIAVCRLTGVPFEAILQGLATFGGAKRRFELRGEAQGIRFIDDYAHHPSEIQATLASAKLQVQNTPTLKRTIAVFQPHRYSRALTFLQEFAQSFRDSDVVVVTDIYSAGEVRPANLEVNALETAIARHHNEVIYCPTHDDVVSCLQKELQHGDLVVFLGAGDINKLIAPLLAHFQNLEQSAPAEVVLR